MLSNKDRELIGEEARKTIDDYSFILS